MSVFRKGHLVRVEALFAKLAPSEQKVAMLILKDPAKVLEMGISDLARASGASDAAVVRFCKKAGYSGFRQFKVAMAQELGSMSPFTGSKEISEIINSHGDMAGLFEKILEAHTSYLKSAFSQLDMAQLEGAAKAITKAKRICLFAVGLSGIVAGELNNRLMRFGFDTQNESSPYAQYMQASKLTSADMAIGISFSGTTKEVVDAVGLAKDMGASTIAITNYPSMPLGQMCDYVISPEIGQNPMDMGMWSVPRVVGLAIVDLLMAAVAFNMKEDIEGVAEASRQAILYKLGI